MKQRTFASIVLPLLHIVLLSLSFNPTSIYPLAWIGLVPLIILLYYYPDRKSVLVVWITGFFFFLINVYWVGIVTIPGYLFLSFYLSWYYLAFGILFLAYRKIRPRAFLFTLPFLWVALEYLRSFLLTGFPWYFVGHSQAPWIRFIQIADIGGVYGITFIVVLCNVFIALVIIHCLRGKFKRQPEPSARQLIGAGLAVLLLVVASLIYGSYRLRETQTETGPTICLIQGNIPQSLKLDFEKHNDMFDTYYQLTRSVIGEEMDLVVWPETMAPGVPNRDEELRSFFERLSVRLQSSLLIGAIAVASEDQEIDDIENAIVYNSAYHFSYEKNGALDGQYDKVHLVPFGEYIPLKRLLPFLRRLVPAGYGILTPGEEIPVFELKDYTFSAAICYENSVAPLVRRISRKDVDFLVVVTNDGWFGDSKELDEHFTINSFRAIENRLPIVYCANTGISGFVDSTGRKERFLKDRSGRARQVAGTLTDSVQIDRRKTFYTKFGDLSVFPCIVIALAGIVPLIRKRRKP